jgi:hypothetical protein
MPYSPFSSAPAAACRMLAAVWLFLSASSPALCQDAVDQLFSEIDSITKQLSEITGLEVRHPVEYDRISREQLRQFLEERMQEELDPKEIAIEEKVLKKFGFVPPDYNLADSTLELLTEQAAAFYDYRKRKLFLVESQGDFMLRMALIHELAHALADQHFNLGRFLDEVKKEDDASLARMAVMEGQASWLMSEFVARQAGQSLLDSDAVFRVLSQVSESEAGQYPVFREAPLYMRTTLLFPYTKGIFFQQKVLEKHGKEGFARVFRKPPSTTRHILHPETYEARFQPARPKPPPLPKSAGKYATVADGALGEVDLHVLIEQFSSRRDADDLAAGWRGGAYRYLEKANGPGSVLAVASEWKDAETAERFFAFYPKALESKWKQFEIRTRTPSKVTGQGDDGYFAVVVRGARVLSLEGLEKPFDLD